MPHPRNPISFVDLKIFNPVLYMNTFVLKTVAQWGSLGSNDVVLSTASSPMIKILCKADFNISYMSEFLDSMSGYGSQLDFL